MSPGHVLKPMNKQVTMYAAMLLIAFFSAMHAAGQSRHDEEEAYAEDDYCEIDSYDFLYADAGQDYAMTPIEDIMDEAFALLGTRYRSGGKGPKGFDCSGFTGYVFGLADINIGCSSRDQYAKNMPVSRDDLQRGDLVFFSSPRSGRGVGHVGIVVDVDSAAGTFSFIHASSRGGVKVSASTDGYYSRRYIGARRVM